MNESERARRFLLNALRNGPQNSRVIRQEAKRKSIPDYYLDEAKRFLRVGHEVLRKPGHPGCFTEWSLPKMNSPEAHRTLAEEIDRVDRDYQNGAISRPIWWLHLQFLSAPRATLDIEETKEKAVEAQVTWPSVLYAKGQLGAKSIRTGYPAKTVAWVLQSAVRYSFQVEHLTPITAAPIEDTGRPEPVGFGAVDLSPVAKSRVGRPKDERTEEAGKWLMEYLFIHGRSEFGNIKKSAEVAGIKWDAVIRAKEKLPLDWDREGFQGRTFWKIKEIE